MVDIESRCILDMTDGSSAELLQELREKRRLTRILPGVVVALAVVLLVLLSNGAPAWSILAIGLVGIASCWWAVQKDALRKTTVILYELEGESERDYESLHDAFRRLRACAKTWHVAGKGKVLDRKYHAGAGALIQRSTITPHIGTPPLVRTNIEVPLLPAGRQTLAFLPDRLLVFEGSSVGAVSYSDLTLRVAGSRFIEEESLPSDATVVDKTWRYVNKKGGPDRRFKDNRELPICMYEELHFTSTSGLNEVVQVSRRGTGEVLHDALRTLRSRSTQATARAV
jgi:hypothetical protein